MDASTTIINWAMAITTRARHRWGSATCGLTGAGDGVGLGDVDGS